MPTYRVHLIYQAEGMRRPLSSEQIIPTEMGAAAVQMAINFIRTAFIGNFEVLAWTLENLDMRPGFKAVGGAFAEQVQNGLVNGDRGTSGQTAEQTVHRDIE
jgi:hypothetical protein